MALTHQYSVKLPIRLRRLIRFYDVYRRYNETFSFNHLQHIQAFIRLFSLLKWQKLNDLFIFQCSLKIPKTLMRKRKSITLKEHVSYSQVECCLHLTVNSMSYAVKGETCFVDYKQQKHRDGAGSFYVVFIKNGSFERSGFSVSITNI